MSLKFTRLDRAAIRRLPVGASLSEHGITVERIASGDVRYSVNIMVGGRRIHRVVGNDSGGVTRYQAELLIEQIRTEARGDRLNLPKARTPMSFERAAEEYLLRLEQSDGRGLRQKRMHLRQHLIPALGTKTLKMLAEIDIERYRRNRIAAGAAKATINRELTTFKHVLVKAQEWGWIDRIAIRAKLYREDGGRIIALPDTEIARLKAAAHAGPDPDLWLFIEIACATGMRHGEIVRIRWRDCDLLSRRIFVPLAKAGSRQQPITQGLADILRRERAMREDQEGWIFPQRYVRSRTGHITTFKEQFRVAVKAAGLDPKLITPHVLRHSVVTKLVQSGADLPTIMKISGHRSLRLILRYAHVSSPHIDATIAHLDKTGS